MEETNFLRAENVEAAEPFSLGSKELLSDDHELTVKPPILDDGEISHGGSSEDENDFGVEIYNPANPFTRVLNKIVPHGGLMSSVYNLAAVTLGSGIITLPSAFEACGVMMSVLILLAITLFTVYSVYILMVAVEKTDKRLYSYEALARGLLGRGWDYFAAFNMWMFCFGSCVSYVISTGDMLSRATDSPSVNEFVRSQAGNRLLTSLIWLVVMLPLSIPKQINSLRYASAIGVSCMMYFVLVVVVHSCMNSFENGKAKNEMAMFKGGNGSIIGFSLFLFAYLCQTNCFEIYTELSKPSPARLTVHTAISMAMCCGLYILTGIFGYLEFGTEMTGSILLMYDIRTDVMVAIAYVGVTIKMCVGFAICMLPTRDSLYYCLGSYWPIFRHIRDVPFWLHAIIIIIMSIFALVLGLFIPTVNIVFGYVGSFSGGFLGFIYPALFIMYAGEWSLRQVGWFHYLSTYALLYSGVAAVIFGTAATIYSQILP